MSSWESRCNLLVVSLAVIGAVALPATAAHALLVKVSVNFGPAITGPENGTLLVTANPGDMLAHYVGAGTDTDILRYDGLISGVDTTEITRDGGSALELTGQGFDPGIYVSPTNTGSDPLDPDSDDDGFSDGVEVNQGTGPNNAGSVPQIPALGGLGAGLLALALLATGGRMLRRRVPAR